MPYSSHELAQQFRAFRVFRGRNTQKDYHTMSTSYAYQGLDNTGKQVRGMLTADDRQQAMAQLKAQDIFPIKVTTAAEAEPSTAASGESKGGFLSGRNLNADVSIFTRQLATLVAGGIPLMSSFSALSAHTENPRLRGILEMMQVEVKGGKTLWETMSVHPNAFSALYVSMVRAGEASGQLASVLNWLADYQEKEQARRTQIRGALAYPIFLAVAGAFAITLLMMFVVPKFAAMFAEFNQALPLPTVILISTASFIGHWGLPILLGIIVAVVLFSRYAKTPTGKLRVDGWRLRMPIFSKLLVRSAMSRFARTTATLMQGGVPLLSALTVVRDVMDNEVLALATDHAREGMREGERFAARLEKTGVFPPFLVHMIGIGEETGDLHSMLLTVANTYDTEVDSTLKGIVSLIEPIIIITLAVIIGAVIMSMLLPIFSINLSAG